MNKPQDFTSFDVIAKLRGIMKMKRLGHAGTLDPMAEGVLPVFVGKATKACDILPYNEKSYTAEFRFGIETDTQDSTGNILSEYSGKITRKDIDGILSNFIGTIWQTPPMYSAVSVNGQRLYKLARQGISIDVPKREAHISELKILSFNEDTQEGSLHIRCGKGTYVRTIIHDIGKALNNGGIMTGLVRTSSNGFNLENCVTFADVEKLCAENRLNEIIIPVDKIFSELPALHLDEKQTFRYKNGVKLELESIKEISNADRYTVYENNGSFIGTAVTDRANGILRVEKNFF